MLEAKDTVMEGNQIAACYGIKANTTHGILWEDARKAVDVEIATRQAEISFKAGIKEVVEDIDLNMLVDWIRRCRATLTDDNMSNALVTDGLENMEKYLISKQAQLKEWGL